MASEVSKPTTTTAKVVVATTVALSFISFWRGASIVLSDLASSAFYAGGAAEQASRQIGALVRAGRHAVQLRGAQRVHGKLQHVRARRRVRGGARQHGAVHGAKFSVSSLVFDYILTGPISVVSAGQYLGALLNEISELLHQSYRIDVNTFAAVFAVLVTIYFWWQQHQGHPRIQRQGAAHHADHHRDGGDPADLVPAHDLRSKTAGHLPPAPLPRNLHFAPDAQGWFTGTFWLQIPMVAIIIAFGHSLLSMSGFETLAQVYREIAYPKLKNLRITANIVCWYAVICTGVITVFAGMIIPDAERAQVLSTI